MVLIRRLNDSVKNRFFKCSVFLLIFLVPIFAGFFQPNNSIDYDSVDFPQSQAIGEPFLTDQISVVYGGGNGNGIYVVGDFAYLADGYNGLVIIKIKNPYSAEKINQISVGGNAQGVFVSGDYAYVAAGLSGLKIVNITDPTNASGFLRIVGGVSDGGNAYNVDVLEDLAFIADGSDGLEIVDVNDPINPIEIGQFNSDGELIDIQVVGNRAYVVEKETDSLLNNFIIIDITNPNNPEELERFTYANCRGLYIQNNYALLAGESLVGYPPIAHTMKNLNLSNINNIIELSHTSYNPSNSSARQGEDVYVCGDLAYLLLMGKGMEIYNISDPTNLVKFGEFKYIGTPRDIFVEGNIVYIADWFQGLKIVKVSSQMELSIISEIPDGIPNDAFDIEINGDIAYVGYGFGGLRIFNISDPTHPIEIEPEFDTEIEYQNYLWMEAWDIEIASTNVFIVDGYNGIKIYDFSNPRKPLPNGIHYSSNEKYCDIEIREGILYLCESYNFRVFDVSAGIVELGNITLTNNATNLDIVNGFAYIANSDDGLVIINSTDPLNGTGSFRIIGELDDDEIGNADLNDVQVIGNFAYLAYGSYGMTIVNISDPTNVSGTFKTVGKYSGPDNVLSLQILDDSAFVVHESGIDIVEIQDFMHPKKYSNFDYEYSIRDLKISGEFAYITCNRGFAILSVNVDYDKDFVSNIFELTNLHTNTKIADTDGDGLTDGLEYYRYKTDPNKRDTDSDGYSDGEEVSSGFNPLDPNSHPVVPDPPYLIFIVVVLGLIFTISSYFYISMQKRKTGINIFISHKVKDFEPYRIEKIAERLSHLKFVDNAYICEQYIGGDIDKWMEHTVPLCQFFILIATQDSLTSEDVYHEIQLALSNELEIIPIINNIEKEGFSKVINDADLSNLNNVKRMIKKPNSFKEVYVDFSKLDLHRKIYIKYDGVDDFSFTKVVENLIEQIKRFKEKKLDSVLGVLRSNSTIHINILETQSGVNKTEIPMIIRHLKNLNKIKGAWTNDHRFFIQHKDVIKKLNETGRPDMFESKEKYIIEAGFSEDSVQDILEIINKKSDVKKRKEEIINI